MQRFPSWRRVAALSTPCVALLLAMVPLTTPVADQQSAAQYAEPDSCALCHKDIAQAQTEYLHGAILARRAKTGQARNCQACHGPSQAHVEKPTDAKPPQSVASLERRASAKMCLTCHSKQVSPIVWRKGNHYAGKVQCWDCHSAARPAKAHSNLLARPASTTCVQCHHEVKGLFQLNSHHPVLVERERRIDCSDCHDPHGRLRERRVTDLCRSCHQAQRGPFRFEHGAISGRLMASCLECHSPHGSPNRDLLKFNGRGLCLQCHGDRVTHFPGPKCWTCHKGVHGSNSSRFLLTE